MREAAQIVLALNDATGAQREVPRPVRRIVSLVPSMTETLFELGLDEEIVGITRFCIHPKDKVRDKERVGGPKDPDLARIVRLKPDLVLLNQEENRLEDVRYLEKRVPVFVDFPRTPDAAAEGIEILGLLAGKEDKARNLAKLVREEISLSRAWVAKKPHRRVLYLVWRRPYMVAGPDTFVSSMLALHGFVSAASAGADRYTKMSPREMAALDLDLILLPTEPFRFRQPHAIELARALSRASSQNQEEWTDALGGDLLAGEGTLSFLLNEGEKDKDKERDAGGKGAAGSGPATAGGTVVSMEGSGKGACEKGAANDRPDDPEAIARWEGRIHLLDGTYPAWHGARMLSALPYLRHFFDELEKPAEAREAHGAAG